MFRSTVVSTTLAKYQGDYILGDGIWVGDTLLDYFIWELPIGSVWTANTMYQIGNLEVRGGRFYRLAKVDPITGACLIEWLEFVGNLDSNEYETTEYWLDWESLLIFQRVCGLGADLED